jgi:hypothetical protein
MLQKVKQPNKSVHTRVTNDFNSLMVQTIKWKQNCFPNLCSEKKETSFVNLFGERLTLKLKKCAYESKTGIKSRKVCCYIPVDFSFAASQKRVFPQMCRIDNAPAI